MFSSLEIKNFRGIEVLKIEGLKNINLFVGKNNSGKTTILEALFLISGPTNPKLPIAINKLREFQKMDEDGFSVLFHNLITKMEIELTAEDFEKNEKRHLTLTTILNFSTKLINERKEFLKENVSNNEKKVTGLTLKYNFKKKNTQNQQFTTKIEFENSQELNIDVKNSKNYDETIRCTFLSQNTLLVGLDERVNNLITNKHKDEIIPSLKEIDSKIIDFHAFDEIVYFDIGLEKFIPINIVGDGVKRILSIVSAIFVNRNGMLLIDEIENGLHFSVQEIFWKIIISSSIKYNVQIFATTHSYECVKALENVVRTLNYENCATLYCINRENEKHKIATLRQEILSTAILNDWEVR